MSIPKRDVLNLGGDAIEVEVAMNEVRDHLSKEGLEAVNLPKVTNLHDTWYQVRFLGTRNGPERLAQLINEYAAGLKVVGVLTPPIVVKMVDGSLLHLVYLAFAPASARIIDKLMEADKNTGFAPEGAVPNG